MLALTQKISRPTSHPFFQAVRTSMGAYYKINPNPQLAPITDAPPLSRSQQDDLAFSTSQFLINYSKDSTPPWIDFPRLTTTVYTARIQTRPITDPNFDLSFSHTELTQGSPTKPLSYFFPDAPPVFLDDAAYRLTSLLEIAKTLPDFNFKLSLVTRSISIPATTTPITYQSRWHIDKGVFLAYNMSYVLDNCRVYGELIPDEGPTIKIEGPHTLLTPEYDHNFITTPESPKKRAHRISFIFVLSTTSLLEKK